MRIVRLTRRYARGLAAFRFTVQTGPGSDNGTRLTRAGGGGGGALIEASGYRVGRGIMQVVDS